MTEYTRRGPRASRRRREFRPVPAAEYGRTSTTRDFRPAWVAFGTQPGLRLEMGAEMDRSSLTSPGGHGRQAGFISVGAVCQRCFSVLVEWVVSSVVGLICLAKRKRALRGRNLPRDSRAEGAPRVHRASGVRRALEALFVSTPIGHPRHASENPAAKPRRALGSTVQLTLAHLRRLIVGALRFVGGIDLAVLRCKSGATRRLDSSLRSHRTWRSQCWHVYSGLNKTLFASVGPNSRCRGHRLANPAKPGQVLGENQSRQSGRIKPGRGHRRDGTPKLGVARIPPQVVRLLERLSSLLGLFSSLLGLVGRGGAISSRLRLRTAFPSRTMA